MNMIIRTMDLVECIADAIDLINPEVSNHHRRVVCIASYLGRACKLSSNQQENLIIAAAVHDIGALRADSLQRLLALDDESGNHPIMGARLLRSFKPFSHVAPIILHHHTRWDLETAIDGSYTILLESRILYLADRISILIRPNFSLRDVDDIVGSILERAGTVFQPDLVDHFVRLAKMESFWLDARDAVIQPMLSQTLARNLQMGENEILALGKLFRQVIDFRSSFTATHSSGVAAVACALAELCGFSSDECLLMQLAGDFHDIGKLAIPESLLEKDGALSSDEFCIIRSHTYYTNRLLSGIKALDTVRIWGALHHERLSGTGYPFKLKDREIPLGARIMSVADIYTAIREDRPYREGMAFDDASMVLKNMVSNANIDGRLVDLLLNNYEAVDARRMQAQESALAEYRAFYQAGHTIEGGAQ